jgi:hypothetical protein
VSVAPVERDQSQRLSLESLARDNAVEGCVRETWGALLALRQASRAADPCVRATMSRIARDEIRHAELAWDIERWLRPRLSVSQRQRVRAARIAAVRELADGLKYQLAPGERDCLGLPGSREAAELLVTLDRQLALTA